MTKTTTNVVMKEQIVIKSKYIIGLLGMALTFSSQMVARTPNTIRATELSPQHWDRFRKGDIKELVVEFREGDEIPVTMQAEGDLLETSEAVASYVTIKRNFWVRVEQGDLKMSLDGVKFKPFNKLISGTLTAGASTEEDGGVANGVSLGLKAILK